MHPSELGRQQMAQGIAADLNEYLLTLPVTLQVPGIANVQVATVEGDSISLTATIDPNGAETTVSIEYGLTDSYGSEQETVTGSPLTETAQVSAVIEGLTGNTLYHFRIKAVNSVGTSYSADATETTLDTSWSLPVVGRASGTPTAGTLVVSATEDITPTVTGDVTISTAQAADGAYRKHTLTVNCPNNGSGTVVFPDRSKIVRLGNKSGVNFYAGNTSTAPIVTWNLDIIPSTLIDIYQATALAGTLLSSGTNALPTGLLDLILSGSNLGWVSTSSLPSGLITLGLSSNTINWVNSGLLPQNLTYLNLAGDLLNYTGLDFSGNGNLTYLRLFSFRVSKLTSAEMVTLINSLANRVGSLPATITLGDYADYASPPQTVVDAVAALKIAKPTVTTVTFSA